LFYTVPRLMKNIKDYEKFFHLIFFVFILGFAAQVVTVYSGFSPAGNFHIFEEEQMEAGKDLRAFYNTAITLLSLFGAIFFLSIKNNSSFPKYYLYAITGMTFFMAFLSATRGWIISIGFIIALFFIIVQKGKNILSISLLFVLLVVIGMTNSQIRDQITFSMERFMTLEAMAGGDQTANGSLLRLTERGPKVMAFWEQHPVFGWGWSNIYLENNDPHVGNQNILMHSGVVGFSLIILFILFFIIKMFGAYKKLGSQNNYKNSALTFIVFFTGWFFLHSTSGQQFCWGSLPDHIFPQAIFLGMSAVLFNLIKVKPSTHEV
jgi:O-antigen ligase